MNSTATLIKDRVTNLRQQSRNEFMANPDGIAHASRLARNMDAILADVYRQTMAGSNIALLATGGYGRGILSPHSDIDLVFLHDSKTDVAEITSAFLYQLWDAHLVVGHQLADRHQLCTAAAGDVSIATALMEARILAGNAELFADFRKNFIAEVMAGRETEYILAKMEECHNRHTRMGDSRFLLEPNVKEGKGGLRDLNTLWWIAKFARRLGDESELLSSGILEDEEYKSYTQAMDFLLQTRAWMHYLTGRSENLLTFDLQREISQRLVEKNNSANEAVEKFMKNYFNWARKVGALNRTICGVLASERVGNKSLILPSFLNFSQQAEISGFPLENQMLSLNNSAEIIENPTLILKLFRISQQHQVEIHPRLLRFFTSHLDCINDEVRNNKEANDLFIEILLASSPQTRTLRRMNDCGVLGAFLPEFNNIVGQMQFDLYHTYTVDEHTLNAIGNIAALASGNFSELMPIASLLIHQISLKKSLYVGLLLHDVAKGMGGMHSDHGWAITARLAPRLGLNEREAETAAWLVANHLLLTHTAFKRDLTEPRTITELVKQIQSLERLKLLLLMTVADINAVGPKIWNGWKGALLRDLYQQAARIMGGDVPEEENNRRIAKLKEELSETTPPDSTYFNFALNSFWLGFPVEIHQSIAAMFTAALADGNAHYEISPHQFHDATELRLCARAQPAMLARLSWACATNGMSIVSARCFSHPAGVAIAALEFQSFDNKPVTDQRKLKKLAEQLNRVTQPGTAMPEGKIAQPRKSARLEAVQVIESVDIDNNISASHTVIEITARDRIGLLYDLSRKCSELGLDVHTAHISTYGVKAVDVFYVQDIFGEKITSPDRLELIKSSLLPC